MCVSASIRAPSVRRRVQVKANDTSRIACSLIETKDSRLMVLKLRLDPRLANGAGQVLFDEKVDELFVREFSEVHCFRIAGELATTTTARIVADGSVSSTYSRLIVAVLQGERVALCAFEVAIRWTGWGLLNRSGGDRGWLHRGRKRRVASIDKRAVGAGR